MWLDLSLRLQFLDCVFKRGGVPGERKGVLARRSRIGLWFSPPVPRADTAETHVSMPGIGIDSKGHLTG